MEHEISGHTRKIYKIWRNPSVSAWKKAKEIFIEILIIVFAVSLAAFLERQREHSHEQKEVKQFLTGLQTDLKNDIREMEQDKISYTFFTNGFSYFASVDSIHVSRDSIKKYIGVIYRTTTLSANDGRYQGFKSSGKITNIENPVLQNDILDLYQESIPNVIASTNLYNTIKLKLQDVMLERAVINNDGTDNIPQLMLVPQIRNYFNALSGTDQILSRYDSVINKSKIIIAAIDREYE